MNAHGEDRLPTGVPGLDRILRGGLLPERGYLVRGGPGAGKTTLGLQFLARGAAEGEGALCVCLTESSGQLRANAASAGVELEGVEFLDLSPSSGFFSEGKSYDVFSSSEVERAPVTKAIMEKVEELEPRRLLFDSMTQFRFLTSDEFQFRKNVLSFLRYLLEYDTTMLFTSEGSVRSPDDDLQYLADGIFDLTYRSNSRFLEVTKFRGSEVLSGEHAFRFTDSGIRVFPRIQPTRTDGAPGQEEHEPFETIPSGISEVNELLGGGIERGTVTVIAGPSGVGKTSLALQFLKETASRGERSAAYIFEETVATLRERARGINMPVDEMRDGDALTLTQVEPLEMSADELGQLVREEVEENGTEMVLLDSVSGYRQSLHGDDLVRRLHGLCNYLRNHGVTVILVVEVEEITGGVRVTDIGVSYLADTIVFLRYFERRAELRKAIGVLKKRTGDFQKYLREFQITSNGIEVRERLEEMEGLLGGGTRMVERPATVRPPDE